MTDDIHEAFDAWIYSVDKRRDANGWEPLTARDVQMLREGYMEAAIALRADIEKLRVRCAELYEANNQRNAAHLVTIQERDALRIEIKMLRALLGKDGDV